MAIKPNYKDSYYDQINGEITIKGRVTQIIKPERIKNMISNSEDVPIRDFDNSGLYLITVVDEDFPKNIIKRWIYSFKNRNREFIRTLAMADNTEHIKIGDVVESKAHMYRKPTKIYVNYTARDGFRHRHGVNHG